MLTGGTNLVAPFKSTEYVSSDGTITMGPNMPEPIDEHCSVNLDEGRSMLITGETQIAEAICFSHRNFLKNSDALCFFYFILFHIFIYWISGEVVHTYDSGSTYIFDHVTEEWSLGPHLIEGRYRFGCGKFKSAAHGGREVIVAAGGYAGSNGLPFSKVEILDFYGDNEWESGTFWYF